MIEQPPQPQEKEGEKQLRDTAFWAEPVETLMVSEAPAGAINLNVAGRRVMVPLQGFGQLWQKTYRVELSGADATPAEVVKIWKERFPEFQPPQNRFYPSMAGVNPGEVLLINATVGGMPVYTGVRVIYADDESFTVMTPEGHPESGWNTFSAFQDDDGSTVAQIQSLARRRPDLRDRLPHRRFDGAGEDLDARPQVARRPLWCERAGDAREGLGRPESPVVASQKCLAQRWDPIRVPRDGHSLAPDTQARQIQS